MADTMTADTLAPAAELAVLDDHPVTNAEYAAFLASNPGVNPDWEPFWPEPDAPAVRVSYHDALAYCAWAGVRLPTDDEWQTWGDSLPPDDPRRLVDGRSVWEWTATPRGDDYPGARRVVRGGSWSNVCHDARAAFRNRYYPDFRSFFVGFRVVRAAPGALASGVTGVPTDDAREVAELRAERDRLAEEVDLWMDATHKSWAEVARLREAMPDADVIDAGADVANEFATTGRANFERGLAVAGDLRQAAARIRALDTGAVRAACGEAV